MHGMIGRLSCGPVSMREAGRRAAADGDVPWSRGEGGIGGGKTMRDASKRKHRCMIMHEGKDLGILETSGLEVVCATLATRRRRANNAVPPTLSVLSVSTLRCWPIRDDRPTGELFTARVAVLGRMAMVTRGHFGQKRRFSSGKNSNSDWSVPFNEKEWVRTHGQDRTTS